mgnify:CR=1 FL=1
MHCLKLSPGARIYATAHNGSFQHESVSPTTIWVLTLAGLGVALLIIWGFVAQRQQQEAAQQLKKQQAAYAIYERNTRVNALTTDNSAEPTPTQQERQNAWEEAPQIRKFSLEHPSATPGPGFSAPGVQTTGAAIVRAIDNAQER